MHAPATSHLADQMSNAELAAIIALLIVAALVYLIPSFVAGARKHPHVGWIFGCNLAFGGTGIGWAACLLWALWTPPKKWALPVSVDAQSTTVPSAAPNPAVERDTVYKLRQLTELRDQQLVTADEFAARRAEILANLTKPESG